MEKWNQLSDEERDFFPLLECLGSLATVSGTAFAPYAKVIYERCLHTLAKTIQAYNVI